MRVYSKQALAIVLLSIWGFFAGCSKHVDDAAITKDIQEKVSADPATKNSDITVTAQNGDVTLHGKVNDAATQQKVEQIAQAEPGAKHVDDETAIVPGAAPNPAETANATPTPAPPVEQPKPEPVVVPVGTAFVVRTDQGLSSKTSQAGRTFLATFAQPVTVAGETAIPSGSSATGTVVAAKSKGKIKGEGELDLALTSITVHGKNYPIQTATLESSAQGKGTRTAKTTGGGAAGGALIGGVAGGGKGAGIGALVGAGAGLVGGAATGNKPIEIPEETPLTFTLSQSVTLPPPRQ